MVHDHVELELLGLAMQDTGKREASGAGTSNCNSKGRSGRHSYVGLDREESRGLVSVAVGEL
jgi:hypothetical protein